MEYLRVLIVDSGVLYRNVLARAVEGTGLAKVSHITSSGALTADRRGKIQADIILLDVNVPATNGLETLKAIQRERPDITMIILSPSNAESISKTVKAFELEAIDFIVKATDFASEKNVNLLSNHLKALFTQVKLKKYAQATARPNLTGGTSIPYPTKMSELAVPNSVLHKLKGFSPEVVLVAASTGGPVALETMFVALPSGYKKPTLVVQHMPPEFTRMLAQTLSKKTALQVHEAYHDEVIQENTVCIAPGGKHMTVECVLKPRRIIKITDSPPVNGVRPSADVLFSSVARTYPGTRILAVVLTGMGNDGMLGVMELKKHCHCYCLTQSEKDCVVYGMPRSVYEAGLSDEVVDIDKMGGRIGQIVLG